MNLTPLSDLILVKEIPGAVNAGFTLIQQNINSLLDKISTTNSTIKLVSAINSVPAGGIGVGNVIVANSAGVVMQIIKVDGNTQTTTYTVDVDGVISGSQLVLVGNAISLIGGGLTVTGKITADGGLDVNSVLDLSKTNSVVKNKYTRINVISANTGTSAAQPLDLSKASRVFLDYTNSASALSNGGKVKLDTTNFVDGQELELYCAGTNASGMKFTNGSNGSEVFAYIDSENGGFATISAATSPTFTPSASPNNQSYMRCMWMNIGSNVYRLVILESLRMTGVS